MQWLALLLLAASAAFAADEWTKVREIKSGTELRIIKKGSRQPILATMDEATEDRLSVATKKEQISIAKEDIDRVDARPSKPSGGVRNESKTTEENPQPARPGMPDVTPGQTRRSSNVSFEGKPNFETVYRRAKVLPAADAGAKAKQ